MNCGGARSLLSPYLDGVLTGRQMQELGDHMAECQACAAEYTMLSQTQQAVASLGRRQPPPELALRLRVMLSQEAARMRRRRWEGFRVRLENALNPMMVPATAGVLTAVIIFGLLIGFFALPVASNDVPTILYTPPQLQAAPFSTSVGISGDAIVVEAYVDANGRVQNYRILSAPKDAESIIPELDNALIFTVFRPATSFGRPTTGKAVLSFSRINVQG
jgi:anti-sigma factor RsiW